MKPKNHPVELSICNRTDLMCDEEFMPKGDIKERCDCANKNICLQIADLLSNKKLDEALKLIDGM